MLATLGGLLALLVGLLLMFLPLLVSELSRPRDSVWGAVVLLLGLVLVTSADRLIGAPMLGVLCGGLLIGRLGLEVGQGRWRQLTPEERQRLGTAERWTTGLGQLGTTTASLLQRLSASAAALGGSLANRRPQPGVATAPGAERPGRHKGKRWVRPEPPSAGEASAEPAAASPAGTTAAVSAGPSADPVAASGAAAEAPESEATPAEPIPSGSERSVPESPVPSSGPTGVNAEQGTPEAAAAAPEPGAGAPADGSVAAFHACGDAGDPEPPAPAGADTSLAGPEPEAPAAGEPESSGG